jgi:hypothetical protein
MSIVPDIKAAGWRPHRTDAKVSAFCGETASGRNEDYAF